MRHAFTRALVLASALALAASAFAGTLTDASKLNQLKPGKTTATQTVALLGKPNQENRAPDGLYTYMYEFRLPNKVDPSQPAVEGVAALLFSKDNVYQGAKMFKKADGKAPTPAGR